MGVLVAMCLLGLLRGSTAIIDDTAFQWQTSAPAEGERIVVVGVLVSDPAPSRTGYRLTLETEFIRWQEETRNEHVRIYVYADRLANAPDRPFDGFRYGDKYRLAGTFFPFEEEGNAGGFVLANSVYLTDETGGNVLTRQLGVARETISSKLAELVSADVAGLAAALTVGDRRHISEDVSSAFRGAGLSHVIAISGMHVSLIGGLITGLSATALGRKRQIYLLLPLVGIWGYAGLAGMSPAVTRSAAMFSVFILGTALGKQRNSLPAIGLVGVIMTALDVELLASVSFQLSFAAVAGIVAFGTSISAWATEQLRNVSDSTTKNILVWGMTGIGVSISATLMTFPIVASTFEEAPLYGSLATLAVLPVLPLMILSSFASAVTGLIWFEAGWVFSWVTSITGYWMIFVGQLFSSIPFGILESGPWPIWAITVWYIGIGSIYFRQEIFNFSMKAWNRAGRLPGPIPRVPTWSAILLVAATVVMWAGVLSSMPKEELIITFFETTEGDIILIESPGGSKVLIDGALEAREAVNALDHVLPFWDRSLDMVMLTHPDADHLGGLEAVIDRYTVEHVLDSAVSHDSGLAGSWTAALAKRGGGHSAEEGMLISLNGGVTLEILRAGNPYESAPVNDGSTVILLHYGEFKALLTGDISRRVELMLADNRDVQADLLKAAHHGSITSSSERFLKAVSPQIAVVTAGSQNRFGHPDQEVMDRLNTIVPNNQIWVTKDSGDIIVRTDGIKVWLETRRRDEFITNIDETSE